MSIVELRIDRPWVKNDFDRLEQHNAALARENFWAFRQVVNPNMVKGWWQREVAIALQQFFEDLQAGKRPKLVLQSPPQHGKALALDTPIPTPSGWTTIGQLEIGDQVFDEAGKPCKVKWVSPVWRNRKVYRVITDDGDEVIADAQHEWLVKLSDSSSHSIVETQQVAERQTRTKRRATILAQKPLQLPEAKLSVDPYVLGVWLGNGAARGNTITCANYDKAVMDEVVALEGGNVRFVKTKASVFTFRAGPAVQGERGGEVSLQGRLRTLGVLSNKHIPPQYLRASEEQRWSLLQGLIDTDAHVSPSGQVTFYQSNERLAYEVQELIWSLGCKAFLAVRRAKLNGRDYGLTYQISFYAKKAARCRKAKRCRDGFKTFRRYIAVEPAGTAHTICIEVDSPSHMFLCGKSMLPTHNSIQVADLIAWIAGKNPQLKTIYASFSDRLGIRANLRLQRMMDNRIYQRLFGARINSDNVVTRSGMPLRNREILEFIGADEDSGIVRTVEGYFRNTTVMGSVTGEGLDLGIIDDPLKGRAEASSKTIRDKTWDWLTDDFMTRFSDHAGLLMIMTRWHVDDPAGRMKEHFPTLKFLQYPAIATEDEEFRKKGEALFPELKSLEFLELQKKPMTQAGWESVYQQNPIIVGGGMFPIAKFGIPDLIKPSRHMVKRTVRAWDKAGTELGGAYTAGVLMHEMKDGRFIVSDVVRGQWGAFDRETVIKQTAVADNADGWLVDTWVEQEPGSGGKESAERTVVNLAGFNVYKDKVRGNKELRADPYAAQVQAGNVRLVRGKWNRDFLDEHEEFPNGKYLDQVDAAGMAFAKLTSRMYQESVETALPIFGDAMS